MTFYVIYCHPAEYPRHWVVRRWQVTEEGLVPSPVGCLCQQLAEARQQLPGRCWPIGRAMQDDPAIAEVWV